MWPLIVCTAGATVVFSASLPLFTVTEPGVEIIRYLCLLLLFFSAVGWLASILRQRRPPSASSPEEPLEFVGNIPPAWKIQFTADLATTPPRPKLPPQSIFLPQARLRLGVTSPIGLDG
jgi:hypothetical protein